MVVPDTPAALNEALEGLVRLNAKLLLAAFRVGRPVPPLYSLGVRYKREPGRREWWQTIADNIDAQIADCEDLASHLAAEHRIDGFLKAFGSSSRVRALPSRMQTELAVSGYFYPARAVCIRTGKRTYHAVTRHPGGRIEDPSRALGMAVPGRRL